MDNLTQNVNLLAQNNFKLIINNSGFSNTGYFAVTANLPGLTATPVSTPFKNYKGWVPGETLEYEQLSVRIALDEDFVAYRELFEWMQSYTTKTGVSQHDLSLIILSSHNNPNQTFSFINAFPTSLGAVEFSTQLSETEYAYVDVQFQYDYFRLEPRSGNNC